MTLHMRVVPEAGSRRSLSQRLRLPGFMTPALSRLQPAGGFNPILIHAVPSLPAQLSGCSSGPIAYVIVETAHHHRRKQAFFFYPHTEDIEIITYDLNI